MWSVSLELTRLKDVNMSPQRKRKSSQNNETSPKMVKRENYVKPNSYRNHICQFCHKDFSKNKWSQANFEKHGQRCSRLIKFIQDGVICKICTKSCGNRIYRHLETEHPTEIGNNENIEQKVTKIKKEKIFVKPEPKENSADDGANFSPKINSDEICGFCDTPVKKANLGRHKKNCEIKHKFVKNLKCTLCGKGFATQSVAYQHLTKMHYEELENAKVNEDSGQFSEIEEEEENESDGKFFTLWKFQDLSVIQILREINFGESRSPKSAVFPILRGSEYC